MYKRSFFPYIGGKSGRRDIVEVVDSIPHHCYVEPFGGAASILFQKKPSAVEIYNDTNDDLVTLFQVVSDPQLFRQFHRRLRWLPYARALFWLALYMPDNGASDPVSRAVRVYVHVRMTFNGMANRGFRASLVRKPATWWFSAKRHLVWIHRRLRGVTIENRDASFVIEHYDSPETLHYIDPPYLNTIDKHLYPMTYDLERHRKLVALMGRLKGAVLLSAYWDSVYRPLFDLGWRVRCREIVIGSALKKGRSTKTRAVELLFANPAALQKMGSFAEDFYGEEILETASFVSRTDNSPGVRIAGADNSSAAFVNSASARRVAKRVRRTVSRTAKAKPGRRRRLRGSGESD